MLAINRMSQHLLLRIRERVYEFLVAPDRKTARNEAGGTGHILNASAKGV